MALRGRVTEAFTICSEKNRKGIALEQCHTNEMPIPACSRSGRCNEAVWMQTVDGGGGIES